MTDLNTILTAITDLTFLLGIVNQYIFVIGEVVVFGLGFIAGNQR